MDHRGKRRRKVCLKVVPRMGDVRVGE
jgi:hypothetical protein